MQTISPASTPSPSPPTSALNTPPNDKSAVQTLPSFATAAKTGATSSFSGRSSVSGKNFSHAHDGSKHGRERGRPIACLFVASLNSARSEQELATAVENHFKRWGPLLHVKVLKDWLQRPYSFVQFQNQEDASRALAEAHNTLLDGRYIRVEQARMNRTIWIAHPTIQPKLQDVRSLLQPFGELEELTATIDRPGFLARFAYRDDAISAFSSLRHSVWSVEWAQNSSASSPQGENGASNGHVKHAAMQRSASHPDSLSKSPAPQAIVNRNKSTGNLSNVGSAPASSHVPTTQRDVSSSSSSPRMPAQSAPMPVPNAPAPMENVLAGAMISPTQAGPHPMFAPAPAMPPTIDPFSIFAGQLDPTHCSRELLIDHFSKFGNVVDCKLIHQGRKSAFAFVRFDTQAAAMSAVSSENKPVFQQKPIRVQFRQIRSVPGPMSMPGCCYGMYPPSAQFMPPTIVGVGPNGMPVGSPINMSMGPMYPYVTPEMCMQGNFFYYGQGALPMTPAPSY
ncbi:RNA-binding protein M [Schizosaccharomyces japonicus yFS275]|uniref:RNA-binding protein M n=1 Tax=Schizosaccharomyces japonicus (strain yFS275 / FY16936) TaxID=402676 RepID=B6JZ93_SCHJY|nr:RNA-binding protein M [Schizosaccharomyces japonicus yFS275]EEB06861.1 RNA-binding protein M [Schizosaccharomyces japonicus yFS275]